MSDLNLIKEFAELDGVIVSEYKGYLITPNDQGHVHHDGITQDWYSPITNNELNLLARDKYHVEIDYDYKCATIFGGEYPCDVKFKDKSEINKAVIECILKNKGISWGK